MEIEQVIAWELVLEKVLALVMAELVLGLFFDFVWDSSVWVLELMLEQTLVEQEQAQV